MSNYVGDQVPYHLPALLKETLEGLDINPSGVYVDVTFGGGGHSREILNRLEDGQLVAFDQDVDTKLNVEKLTADLQGRSFTFIGANFRYLKKYLRLNQLSHVDGILADLGVSLHTSTSGCEVVNSGALGSITLITCRYSHGPSSGY